MTSVVPPRPLFLILRADFSPRGLCEIEFFSSLFSRQHKLHPATQQANLL